MAYRDPDSDDYAPPRSAKRPRPVEEDDDEVSTDPFEPLRARGFITEVLYEVKSGKEATVYCCRADPSVGAPLVAAKLYRDQKHRSFRSTTTYLDGRFRQENRVTRAMKNKSSFGQQMSQMAWASHEYGLLTRLFKAGLDVPRPITCTERVILMEYFGDAQEPAPLLKEAELPLPIVRRCFERVLWNVEKMLDLNVVHGDLSPYNMLWWNGKITLIDLPQGIDPRFNLEAEKLLSRDVHNVCRAFAKWGVNSNAEVITKDLWTRFENGKLSGRR